MPIAILLSPVVIAVPASLPMVTLLFPPLVILSPAFSPIRMLSVPAVAVIRSAPASIVMSPEIATVPLKSSAVAVKSISSVAPNDKTVALDPCMNWLASLNMILLVLFNVRPLPSVCVSVVSASAPKLMTALSEVNVRSSSINRSGTAKSWNASTIAAPDPAPSL